MELDAVIVGAGISGLTCARQAARDDLRVVVLEKSRGVGGRCATRRIHGRPVDHGVTFVHGNDAGFLEDVVASAERPARLDGWPVRVQGEGTPCLRRTLRAGERRVAFRDGVTVFPKYLARDVDVRFETRAVALRPAPAGVEIETDDGARWRARAGVLALPPAQARDLLATVPDPGDEVRAALRLTGEFGGVPCLTLIAGYPADGAAPEWDLFLPEQSPCIHLASHDSAKRASPRHRVLVYQGLPHWSRAYIEQSPDVWSATMLEEAARLLGQWAGRPAWTQSHRWRYARANGAAELKRPMLLALGERGVIGLAGETFSRDGGVQAAWRSGIELAKRLSATIGRHR